jgi:hypothetical protein
MHCCRLIHRCKPASSSPSLHATYFGMQVAKAAYATPSKWLLCCLNYERACSSPISLLTQRRWPRPRMTSPPASGCWGGGRCSRQCRHQCNPASFYFSFFCSPHNAGGQGSIRRHHSQVAAVSALKLQTRLFLSCFSCQTTQVAKAAYDPTTHKWLLEGAM